MVGLLRGSSLSQCCGISYTYVSLVAAAFVRNLSKLRFLPHCMRMIQAKSLNAILEYDRRVFILTLLAGQGIQQLAVINFISH